MPLQCLLDVMILNRISFFKESGAVFIGIRSVFFACDSTVLAPQGLQFLASDTLLLFIGTLFQNNFEELFTSLNLVRTGFVKTFAKSAGLNYNLPVISSDITNLFLFALTESMGAKLDH